MMSEVKDLHDGLRQVALTTQVLAKTVRDIGGMRTSLEALKENNLHLQQNGANILKNLRAEIQLEMRQDISTQVRHRLANAGVLRRRSRSRSDICHCGPTKRFNKRKDDPLICGDIVWLCSKHDGKPDMLRYFQFASHGSYHLTSDKAGKIKHRSAVRSYELFIVKDICRSCRRKGGR